MWGQLLDTILKTEFLFSVIRITAPILFAALGAVIAEKAGVTNIGLEGIMMISALFGTIAPPAGVWSVTVSPLPTVRKLKPFALRRSAAASNIAASTGFA